MLMDIKCGVITSIKVMLRFDDDTVKKRIISEGDVIDVEYNNDGLRRRIIGKVSRIYVSTLDPKSWFFIVDGSGDFKSEQARVCPMNILNIEILRRADHVHHIVTPKDETGIEGLRIKDGVLEYTTDGYTWNPITVAADNIEPDPNVTNDILQQAKDYTDIEMANAKNYTDTRINDTKAYVDDAVNIVNTTITDLETSLTTKIDDTKLYVDEQIEDAKKYTDDSIKINTKNRVKIVPRKPDISISEENVLYYYDDDGIQKQTVFNSGKEITIVSQ